MRQKLAVLFERVKELEKISSKAASESHKAANESSSGLTASYSAAGDAEHSRNTANLSLQKAATVKDLLREIEKSKDMEIPNVIQSVCFVLVEFENGSKKELYLVDNPVFIDGFNLISPSSPLGSSLLGRSANDYFYYSSGEQEFSGKILEIS